MTEIRLQDEAWEETEEDTEGLVDEWHVKVGDKVDAGQLLATVIVAKTKFEVLAPSAGVVAELMVPAQENFPRGQALATLTT
jgi:pyruvate/2-oxoglutarate dehydrogenase complex dihydrolipoamide acyltransferase (E2) component